MNLPSRTFVLFGTLAFASRAAAQDAPTNELPPEPIPADSPHAPGGATNPPPDVGTILAPVEVRSFEVRDPNEFRPPPIHIPPRRMEFGASIEYLRMIGSSYDNLVALWGYDGFYNSVQLSARAFGVLRRVLLLGGRIGYVHVDGGRARADNETLAGNVVDVSAALRIRHEWAGRRVIGRAGFDLEFGPAFGTVILRGQTDGFASLRLGATVFIGFAPTPESPAIVFRLGAQYLPYAGAGGAWGDPVFAGVFLGAGLEGAR